MNALHGNLLNLRLPTDAGTDVRRMAHLAENGERKVHQQAGSRRYQGLIKACKSMKYEIVEQSTPDHAAQARPARPDAGRHGRECHRYRQQEKKI